MRKLYSTAAVIVAALAVIAATQTDPLAELKQAVADLTTQAEDHEVRLAYLERFTPIDTFQPIEGAGSTAELAADVNKRILLADGIEIAVTSAEVVRSLSDIRNLVEIYGDWISPPSGFKVVLVDVNIYNASRERGLIESGMCPWESRDTLATDYRGYCEEAMFWNITVDGVDYPLATPRDWGIGLAEEGVTANESTLYFHVEAARPLDGLMTYKHPDNEDSHRYWKLKRPTRERQ